MVTASLCEFCIVTDKENVSPDALTLFDDGEPLTVKADGLTNTIDCAVEVTPPDCPVHE